MERPGEKGFEKLASKKIAGIVLLEREIYGELCVKKGWRSVPLVNCPFLQALPLYVRYAIDPSGGCKTSQDTDVS